MKIYLLIYALAPCLLVSGTAACAPDLQRLALSQLIVTEGSLLELPDQRMRVSGDRLRAVAQRSGQRIGELRFLYNGPSVDTTPLESGLLRRQVGLKLRAMDTCNVLYVMWRVEPQSMLAVQLKSNRGKHEHSQCGNDGYQMLRPRSFRSVPALREGAGHVLRAEIAGAVLRVYADQTLVWEGDLPTEAQVLDGPVGLRTDNGRFDLDLFSDTPEPR